MPERRRPQRTRSDRRSQAHHTPGFGRISVGVSIEGSFVISRVSNPAIGDADDRPPGKPWMIDPAGGEQSDRSVCNECLVDCEERLTSCRGAAVHGRLDEDLFNLLN